MAYDKSPSAVWPTYTSDAGSISIPLAALGISESAALDWRNVVRGLVERQRIYQESLPTASRSKVLTMNRPVVILQPTTLGIGDNRVDYTGAIYLDVLLNTVVVE